MKKSTYKPVSPDNCSIKVVPEYKYLGTIIDEKVSFTAYTDRIYKNNASKGVLLVLIPSHLFYITKVLYKAFYVLAYKAGFVPFH